MSRRQVMRDPARSCATLRRTAQDHRNLEAAGIEPAPGRGLTGDAPSLLCPGEGRQSAEMAASAWPFTAGTISRFWSKVDRSGECWLWRGSRFSTGYGHFTAGGVLLRAHRVAFELANGPIPEGLVLDHICNVRHCVNPAHLRAVTNRENVLRGQHPNAIAWRTSTCRRGHSLTDAYVKANGTRNCRTCNREQHRRPAANQPRRRSSR